jgi:hypothetical protein
MILIHSAPSQNETVSMVLLKENIVSVLSECSDAGSTRACTILLHVGYFN